MTRLEFQPAALNPQAIAPDDIYPFWPAMPGIGLDLLKESILELGLLHPLLAFEEQGRLKLLAGTRRLKVVQGLGWNTVPVMVLPPDMPRKVMLAAALADNVERGFNAAETALIWDFLAAHEAGSAEDLSRYLNLKNAPKLRQWCRAAASLPADCLEFLADGRLDLELAARLASWRADDRLEVLRLFELLAPSKQKKKQWLDWLEDISRREQINPALILMDETVAAALALAATRGRPAAEAAARRLIWERRHPVLAELFRRREERLKSLPLPSNLRLELDPSLEDLKFTLNMSFSGLEDYERLLTLLGSFKHNQSFLKLVDDSEDPVPDIMGSGWNNQ